MVKRGVLCSFGSACELRKFEATELWVSWSLWSLDELLKICLSELEPCLPQLHLTSLQPVFTHSPVYPTHSSSTSQVPFRMHFHTAVVCYREAEWREAVGDGNWHGVETHILAGNAYAATTWSPKTLTVQLRRGCGLGERECSTMLEWGLLECSNPQPSPQSVIRNPHTISTPTSTHPHSPANS